MKRSTILILAPSVFLTCGCAASIARSGKDLGTLATRDQVRQSLGAPDSSGQHILAAQPEFYDEYRTHHKIADTGKAQTLATTSTMSAGLGEFIMIPSETFIAARRLIFGQSVEFNYDEAGNVTSVYLDRQRLSFWPKPAWSSG